MNFRLGIFFVFFENLCFVGCVFYECWQVLEEPYSRVVYTLLEFRQMR